MIQCRRAPILASLLATSLLVAACGSSSPSSFSASGSEGQSSQTRQDQQLVNFAGCMRSHGVSNFPDPSTGAFKFALAPNTPHSPAFLSAYTACGHLLPTGGGQGDRHSPAQVAEFVAFARCIRSHGFPGFPDPTSSGQLTHEMIAGAGINLHQPAVVQAADACVSVTHGVITKADVARFVAGQ